MASVGETALGGIRDRVPVPSAMLSVAVLVPAVAVTLSEIALFAGRTDLALWAHFVTLLFCVFAPLRYDDVAMFQVFALVPMFRLVNLGMPVFLELTLFWFPVVYAPLFPAIYVVGTASDVSPLSFRPKLGAALAVPGIALAVLLGEIEYAIIEPGALIPSWTATNVVLLTVVMVAFVGFVEEAVYRGFLQRTLEDRIGTVGGLLLASFLFGMMHSAYGTPAEIGFAAGIGLLFGIIYNATDSMLLVTILHGILNVTLFGLVPIHGSLFGFG